MKGERKYPIEIEKQKVEDCRGEEGVVVWKVPTKGHRVPAEENQ